MPKENEGRDSLQRVNGPDRYLKRQNHSISLDDCNDGVIGTAELCAWRVAPGVSRIQTSNPQFARKLKQRESCRLVAWSVMGGYLRVFEEAKPLSWARQLIRRYMATMTPAGKGILSLRLPAFASESPERGEVAVHGV